MDRYSLVYSPALEARIHDAYRHAYDSAALDTFSQRTFVFKLGWYITFQNIIVFEVCQDENLSLEKIA